MADERLQPPAKACRCDDNVGLYPNAAPQAHNAGVERLDFCYHFDRTISDRLDHVAIDDGGSLADARGPRKWALRWNRQAEFGQVPKLIRRASREI